MAERKANPERIKLPFVPFTLAAPAAVQDPDDVGVTVEVVHVVQLPANPQTEQPAGQEVEQLAGTGITNPVAQAAQNPDVREMIQFETGVPETHVPATVK